MPRRTCIALPGVPLHPIQRGNRLNSGHMSYNASMVEDIENLILEHLRALRAGQDKLQQSVDELRVRVGSLESHVASLRRDVALIHEDVAAINARLDRHEERLTRIEKRLDIVSSPL
jgi:chromosome segregation ATPase